MRSKINDKELPAAIAEYIVGSPQQRKQRKQRLALTLLLCAFVFAVVLLVILMTGAVIVFLVSRGALPQFTLEKSDAYSLIWIMIQTSVILGAIAAFFLSRFVLSPVNTIINAMNSLAEGDFSTRIHFSSLLSRHPTVMELTDSFNTMAQELQGTEMLRSDFINNFSHEFKTPIVSIAGFAKILKNVHLSEEERNEYLDIMEEESLRLSNMATNVLTLTRLENQTILSNARVFNLSEQIRNCVLMLEKKWDEKHLDISIDLEEYEISGNEEQLRQVWINLLDNAIKFSPEYGVVRIGIKRPENTLVVTIENEGTIPAGSVSRIFKKFYQADESHASEGNGIGLSIVLKIVSLHGGTVSVRSTDGITRFTVSLPTPGQSVRS